MPFRGQDAKLTNKTNMVENVGGNMTDSVFPLSHEADIDRQQHQSLDEGYPSYDHSISNDHSSI